MVDDIAGPAFPFRVDPATGGIAWSTGSEKLRQNIRLIIGTRYGERPMQRDFGTRIYSLVQDPNDDVIADLLQSQVQQAILQFEPRVIVSGTTVTQSEGEISLVLSYTHTQEPVADQLILPLF